MELAIAWTSAGKSSPGPGEADEEENFKMETFRSG